VVVTSPQLDPFVDRDEARWHARRAGCHLDEVVLRFDADMVAGILAAAASPDSLLCLATSARGGMVDLVARSVSHRLICRSEQPVLVVGPAVAVDDPGPIEHLLCCIDDEPALTDLLLEVTGAWAEMLGCSPHLVRVVPPHVGDRVGAALDARESLDTAVRRLWARGVPATSGLVVSDDIIGAIARCAGRRRRSAVVLASHGRSGLRRLAAGSVTVDVLRHSPAPALVVPARRVLSARSAPEAAVGAPGLLVG
jgi:nucleotide-binding universal stress UspA family protein